jgi:hypothetical protein
MVRYFSVVSRPPLYGLVALLAVTALGVATTWLNPREIDSSLGMVLLVHMLLASSGFAPAARRGHFDPILAREQDRRPVLTAHWCASIAPGAVAWAVIALTGVIFGTPAAISALAGSRLVAFATVSALAWSAGFALPRGGGGALWIGVLAVLLVWHADLLARGAAPASPVDVLRASGTVLLCPFLLLGSRVSIGPPALTGAAAAAFMVLVGTWRRGADLDVFLEERS